MPERLGGGKYSRRCALERRRGLGTNNRATKRITTVAAGRNAAKYWLSPGR